MKTSANDKPSDIQRPDWLSREVWPHQIRATVADGNPIAYTDEGTGPTLLLVHDGMWSYVWGQLIQGLKGQFRILTLDFPGSGLSPPGDRPVGLEADSRLLEAFVDRLDLGAVTLLLHDLGGPVGVGLAARRPELVRGMVFAQTFSWPPQHGLLRMMLGLVSSRPATTFDVATNLVFRLTTSSLGLGRHLDRRGRAAFLGPYRKREPRRRFHRMMGAAQREREYLAQMERALETELSSKPALTIYGENNDPFGFQARFKEIFPEAHEMVIPNGNHFPMADDPEGVGERIISWHQREIPALDQTAFDHGARPHSRRA